MSVPLSQNLAQMAQKVYGELAHPKDIAAAYGINPQTVYDARYKGRTLSGKYNGHVILKWSDVEESRGLRPDRFVILVDDGLYSLYRVNPVTQTVECFINDFYSEEAARKEAKAHGVKTRYLKRIRLEWYGEGIAA